MGSLEVGFVDSPSTGYQAISLNVVSVRLNPSTDAAIPDTDPNWVVVTAPPGSGSTSTAELSINLLDLQNNAKVFNTGSVTAQVYHQVEVVFDPNYPGVVIPSCGSGSQEGCVDYPATFTGLTNLRTTATVSINSGGLTPLIIDINPGAIVAPSSPGGNYTLNPTISVASPSTYLATITGTVTNALSAGNTINAELTGTNTVIASAPISSSSPYTLAVPAQTGGTTYDLFVAGPTTFAAASGVTVTPGSATTKNFTVASASVVSLSGAIIDKRVPSQTISGATITLLLPPTPSTNCATAPGCVAVETASSDSAGNYALASVPFATYYVQAQATGVSTTTQQSVVSSDTPTCTGSPNASNCSFLMPNTLMTGQVMVDPPPAAGTNTSVLVMAEQPGTGNLVGLTSVVAPPLASTPVPFSMEVPTTIDNMPADSFDLIAAAQDTYLGIGTQYPAHTLAVAANVPNTGPTTPLTVGCVGHGSIVGQANNPLVTTHVRLYKLDAATAALVQLMDTSTGPPGTANAGQYSLCAPPDSYALQRFEESQATAVPVGTDQPIMVPTPAPAPTVIPTPGPAASPTPCPLCVNSAGQCPGNCKQTTAIPLD